MCVNLAAGGRRPLKQASIPLVPMQVCRRRDWLGAEFTLTDRMMCAGYEHGGVDTCQARPLFFHRLQNLCRCKKYYTRQSHDGLPHAHLAYVIISSISFF